MPCESELVEVSLMIEISTNSDSHGIIEYQIFCSVFCILQVNLGQTLVKLFLLVFPESFQLQWCANQANAVSFRGNCCILWRLHHGCLSTNPLLWCKWMRCFTALCSKEENAKLPSAFVHWAHYSWLEACMWRGLHRSTDSALFHACFGAGCWRQHWQKPYPAVNSRLVQRRGDLLFWKWELNDMYYEF